MGFFKKVGKGLKKIGKGVGKAWEKIDDFALPAVGFALGGPAGAALGSAAARGIGDGKFNAKATLLAGAKGYAGGQLASSAGLVGGKGIGTLGSSARSALSNPISSAKSMMGMGGGGGGGQAAMASPAVSAGGGGSMGGLRRVGKFAMDNIDPILGGLAAYEGYRADKRGQKLQDRALALQEQEYAMRAPLRQKAMGMLMEDEPARLPRYRSQNPFGQ